MGVLPKWEPRSRSGIYLVHPPLYAGSVALVLNPATGDVNANFSGNWVQAYSGNTENLM